jgi:hypothetical protein
MEHFETCGRRGLTRSPKGIVSVMALAGLFVLGIGSVGLQGAGAATHGSEGTGFSPPVSGTPQYEHVAPPELSDSRQLNRPLGQPLADEIAREIGLKKSDVLTDEQRRPGDARGGRQGALQPGGLVLRLMTRRGFQAPNYDRTTLAIRMDPRMPAK